MEEKTEKEKTFPKNISNDTFRMGSVFVQKTEKDFFSKNLSYKVESFDLIWYIPCIEYKCIQMANNERENGP